MKSVLIFILIPFFLFAEDVFHFSSPNLCARQSTLPAKSIYLFVDGFGPGRAATKWARDANLDKVELVNKTWQQLHARSFFLAKRVMSLLLSKDLPIISEDFLKRCGSSLNCPDYKRLVQENLNKLINNSMEQKKTVQCAWIKKSLPLFYSTKPPAKTDLEDMAVAYLDKANFIDSCEKIFSGDTKNNSELVLKFDLASQNNWDKTGFEFWRSFKIYLSLFWGQKLNHPAMKDQEIVRSFAVDEVLTLMADGCYSLSRPECNTDFLNVSQLKNTIKKGGFSDSLLMANEVMKKQMSGFDSRMQGQNQNNSPAIDIRSDMLSLMKMRHQSSYQLYKSVRNLSLIFNQKSSTDLVATLTPLLMDPKASSEMYTLCAEVNKLIRTDMSPFAKELSISQNKVGSLNALPNFSKRPEDLFFLGMQYLEALKPACESLERTLKVKMLSSNLQDIDKVVPSRKWFQTITQYTLPIELSASSPVTIESNLNIKDAYVRVKDEVVCATITGCTRDIVEGLVNIYHVALYHGVTGNVLANEVMGERHLGADVACGLFDPWEQSQLRKRNLISDLVSSVISGVSMLPIYLDLDFDTKKLVSFSQLYENGKIKFDPLFDDKTTRTTLFLDLGPLAKAPCYINISDSSRIKNPNRALLFQGISFQGCIQTTDGQMASDNLNLTINRSDSLSACGACQINFEEVAVASAASHYSIFRFGIRFVSAWVSYFKESESPVSQPIEFEVNPEFVKETYLKYNSIPDSCMYELVNGARCMENICLSSTISQVEKLWSIKVKDGSLWNSRDNEGGFTDGVYTDAWIKLEGCDRETRIPINCSQGKKPDSVLISKSPPACARRAP